MLERGKGRVARSPHHLGLGICVTGSRPLLLPAACFVVNQSIWVPPVHSMTSLACCVTVLVHVRRVPRSFQTEMEHPFGTVCVGLAGDL